MPTRIDELAPELEPRKQLSPYAVPDAEARARLNEQRLFFGRRDLAIERAFGRLSRAAVAVIKR